MFCARSDNDTGNNPHNPMYGINKAGADGDLVTLIGTESSASGGNSEAPLTMIDPSVRPVKVDRPQDATGLVDTGKLVELLDPNEAAGVMGAMERITDLKLEKMTVEDLGTASTFLLVYDPAGRPQLTRPAAQQIGYFRTSGSVETGANRISNNVDRLAESIVLNYLALHGEVGRFDQVLPDHGLGTGAELDALVAFQPIRSG